MSRGFVALQRLLPKALLSRLLGYPARSEAAWIAQPLIRAFMRAYDVSLADAARTAPGDYRSFNDFFSRELAPGARHLQGGPGTLICPADGVLSEFGAVEAGSAIAAKGQRFRIAELLGDADRASRFKDGHFATVYLAPKNYHRVHAPMPGTLTHSTALPGALYSVNERTVAGLPNLFARNERLVCHFDSLQGPAALVMIGALIVASIDMRWPEVASPYRTRSDRAQSFGFEQGDELGRFLLGSTVVLCLPPGLHFSAALRAGMTVRMGQELGNWSQAAN